MVMNFPPKFRRSLGGGSLESSVWRRLGCNRVWTQVWQALYRRYVDGPQFSSLASPPEPCYQRHFLKRAFRKAGRTTK